MQNLKDLLIENEKQMTIYINAITKVHGKNHPEAFEIRDIYYKVMANIKEGKTNLTEYFERLSVITNHFTIPNDVCETYEAVIKHLHRVFELSSDEVVIN